ncbi:MAG: hypothetical protein V1822_00955 [Candidatus Micrarchaeota archaeon]
MIKYVFFGLLILALFAASPFAQAPLCTNEATMCDANLDSMWTCVNGIWADQTFCLNKCDQATQKCKTAPDNPPASGTCYPFEQGLTRCDPIDLSQLTVQQCQLSSSGTYDWLPLESCYPGANNDLGCYEASYGDAYCKECANPGDRSCAGISAFQVCQDDYKYSTTSCNYPQEICISGYCEENTNGETCTIGEERCTSNVIEQCQDKNGVIDFFPYSACTSSQYCEEYGSDPRLARCRDLSSGSSGSGGGSSSGSGGSGGAGSGGGEVFRPVQECSSYTDWQAVGATSFTRSNADGTTQQCTNTTLERYCVYSNGQTDSSKKETDYAIDCSNPSDKCDYIYSRTENFTDKNEDGMCRSCERETYVYTCQPSGKVDLSNTKESVTCGSYGTCQPQFPTANTSWFDSLFSGWAIPIGIIVILAIAAIAFLAYKMNDEDGEGGNQGETGNEESQSGNKGEAE